MTVSSTPTLRDRVTTDSELGLRLQLACAGLHPDAALVLLDSHGPRGAVSRVDVSARQPRLRHAVRVPASQRAEELAALGIGVVFKGDVDYPARLSERSNAPDLLFVRGQLPTRPTVAVVGTRKCSAYGRNLAVAYGSAIADAGWVLVSGLARGIDGAAHRGTVAAGGRGVAVLGCGLDIAYPREHAKLRDELLENGGAVLSEYPPCTPPEAWRFPPRNRIISGMARAVVVVEAAVKGGALITANAALDQGVPVLATPGDVGRSSAAGCNLLIRDGAHPVLDPADLIAELELIVGPADHHAERVTEWAWEGITVERMAVARAMTIAEAAATLTRAELAGALVRDGDRYYPAPAAGR